MNLYLVDKINKICYIQDMLEGIFGNQTAERVMLHIYHYREIHASAIASDYDMALNPVLQQLKRFESAGILVSKQVGRSRVFFLNQKSAFAKPIQEIVRIAYESIPLEERQAIFKTRRRPRRKGKPIL